MAIKEVLHSDFAPRAVGPYAQAVVTGNLIFTSGQVPVSYTHLASTVSVGSASLPRIAQR